MLRGYLRSPMRTQTSLPCGAQTVGLLLRCSGDTPLTAWVWPTDHSYRTATRQLHGHIHSLAYRQLLYSTALAARACSPNRYLVLFPSSTQTILSRLLNITLYQYATDPFLQPLLTLLSRYPLQEDPSLHEWIMNSDTISVKY